MRILATLAKRGVQVCQADWPECADRLISPQAAGAEGSGDVSQTVNWQPEVNLLWPSPTDEWLLRAATGPVEQAADAFAQWKRAADFREYREIDFESSRLLPLVWRQLGGPACEDGWAAHMSGLRRYHWVHNSARQRDLWRLIGALNAAGVTPWLLKGSALVQAGYYDDIGLRPMLDADLLVAPQEAECASIVLREQGWRRLRSKAGRGFPLAHAESWRDAAGREIDLHVKLLPYPYPAWGAAAVGPFSAPATVADCEFRLPSATDLLLHACVHGRIYAGGDPRRSLLWAADVCRILNFGGAVLDWERLERQAAECCAVLPLREALGFAAARLGAPVPQVWLDRLKQRALSRAELRPFFRRIGPRNRYPTLAELWENAWDDYACGVASKQRLPTRCGFAAFAGRGLWRGASSGAAVKYAARIAWRTLQRGPAALGRPDLARAAADRLAEIAERRAA